MSITSIAHNTPARIVAGVLGIAVAISLAFGVVVAPAQAITIDELLAQIAALQTQLLALQGGSGSTASAACPYTWTRNLTTGASGADVMKLQQFLNSSADTMVAASGVGSKGNETSYFGPATKSAVIKFQNKHSADVLAPVGLSAGTGFFGASSRAKANALCTTGAPTSGGGTTTPPPATGTGLSVSSAAQPANSIAPDNAARIPFTKFTVTAAADGDVVLNGVTVERQGLAADAAFSGVMLLDAEGIQIGTTRTLNSNHQATVGEAVTIPRGTSRTFTVAANRADTSTHAGSIASFAVVAVNTSAAVSGSLPISGASHTINETLSIGSVTAARGSNDPGANQTKEVGTTGYTFSSIRLTAGSAEKVYLKSLRWNQTGSASVSADLANLKTVVDGTEYAIVSSADGKFFTAVFPGTGLLIDKGFSKDVSIKADIVGGSDRTVDFDIAKRSDINVVGENFGFGILAGVAGSAASTDGAAVNNADDYYYDAAQVTISKGTMTVSTWSSVTASNIAENQANQTLAGFSVDVKGEAISVAQMVFRMYHTQSSGSGAFTWDDIDSISLVDQNGSVVAGPVDAAAGAGSTASTSKVTFTDTITFPVGVTNLTLKGKVGTAFASNDTVAASTTPSSDWTTVTGQVTGQTITPNPASALTGPTMTVKAGALTVSVSSVPLAQTVIAGSNDFEFARYIFDGTASGEDLRITTMPLYFDTNGTRTDLTSCRIFDGATSLTTGSNVKNPATGDTASSTTFTFDGTGFILSKGTAKTLSLKCNIRSGATSGYWWGIDAGQNASFTGVSGVTSGQTVTETFTDGSGQIMSASSGGSMNIVLDSNSPGVKMVAAGTTGVELARLRFTAASEDVDLKQVALQLTTVASNTPVDLVNREVKLYTEDGTLIGSAVFPTGDNATSSLIASGSFRIPRDGAKVMVVKGDIAGISNSGPLTASGDLLKVDHDTNNEDATDGTYGTGVSSGSNVAPSTSSDTASSGVRVMRSYPLFAHIPLTETLIANGEEQLYRFSVTATGGDVALYKLTFSVASSSVAATTTTYGLYAYTNSSFSSIDNAFSSTGVLNASNRINGLGVNAPDAIGDAISPTVIEIYPDKASATTTYIVPSGATRYFELRATVENAESGTGTETITTSLQGDATFPVAGIETAALVDADTHNDLVWSPVSTTTQNLITDFDFTNGANVPGLAPTNMNTQAVTTD